MNDKIQHVLVCYFLTTFFSIWGIWVGIGAAVIWGAGKELWDWKSGGKVDVIDLLADLAGILCGLFVTIC